MPHRLAVVTTTDDLSSSDLEWPFHASRAISAVAGLLVFIYSTFPPTFVFPFPP